MIAPTDLAVQWSTRYETLFRTQYNATIAVQRALISPILMEIPLPDFQGNAIELDWLGAAPQMRRWVDEKRAIGLNKNKIRAVVERFEATMEIDLDALRDARGNVYEPRIQEMAANGARIDYRLVSDLIAGGEGGDAYDGKKFYAANHQEGKSGAQSNLIAGGGVADIAAVRTDYYKAVAALTGFKDDQGEPLHPTDFRPQIWIPNNAAMVELFETLQAALLVSGGNTNVLANRFDLVKDPRLAGTSWYVNRTDTVMKPFIMVNREEPNYEDNFGTGHPDVWSRRIGQASVVGRKVAAYGLWQTSVKIKN